MNAMDCQLQQYAKDFQVLVGLHRDLERRYDHLSSSHRKLTGAGEVLRSMSPHTRVLCLVTNLQGDIVQATDRARALFEQTVKRVTPIQSVVTLLHLPRLESLLESEQCGGFIAAADEPEILLNPTGEALYGEIYVMRRLQAVRGKTSMVHWFIHELGKREQREFTSNPLGAQSIARPTGAVVFDVAGSLVAMDAGFQRLTGHEERNAREIKLSMFHTPVPEYVKRFDLLSEVHRMGQWQGEVSAIGDQRLVYRQWMSVSAIEDTSRKVVAYAAQLVDCEKMLMAERFLLDAHYRDAVSGLPNRKSFKEQAAKRIAAARQAQAHVALLSIMLDRSKWIRDTHDSAVSDAVVLKIGERLLRQIRGCDILARAYDDEFLLLISGPNSDAELAIIATQMIKSLSEPVFVQHQALRIGGSIGCAMFPQDGSDLPTLTKNAESAMRLARKAGGNRYCLYKHRCQPDPAADPNRNVPTDIDQCDIPTINMKLSA